MFSISYRDTSNHNNYTRLKYRTSSRKLQGSLGCRAQERIQDVRDSRSEAIVTKCNQYYLLVLGRRNTRKYYKNILYYLVIFPYSVSPTKHQKAYVICLSSKGSRLAKSHGKVRAFPRPPGLLGLFARFLLLPRFPSLRPALPDLQSCTARRNYRGPPRRVPSEWRAPGDL